MPVCVFPVALQARLRHTQQAQCLTKTFCPQYNLDFPHAHAKMKPEDFLEAQAMFRWSDMCLILEKPDTELLTNPDKVMRRNLFDW